MNHPEYLSGRILLAMPGMSDPRFERAMIAMCKHDEDGAFGIGLGDVHPRVRLHEVLREIDIDPGLAPDAPVHVGGPVEPGRGFVLHTPDWGGEGTVQIADLCALSASLDILRAITEGRGPEKWLVALGYAGWGPGQLDGEMRRHGWYAAQGRSALLFDTLPEARWNATWTAEGIDPAHLANVTGSA